MLRVARQPTPNHRSGPTLCVLLQRRSPRKTVALPMVGHATVQRETKSPTYTQKPVLTSVIRSYSFVIADTERVQYGGYVHIAHVIPR